ncbi:MAG: hypothetical protein AAB425_12940 [Bdellovibrionota bacterium]
MKRILGLSLVVAILASSYAFAGDVGTNPRTQPRDGRIDQTATVGLVAISENFKLFDDQASDTATPIEMFKRLVTSNDGRYELGAAAYEFVVALGFKTEAVRSRLDVLITENGGDRAIKSADQIVTLLFGAEAANSMTLKDTRSSMGVSFRVTAPSMSKAEWRKLNGAVLNAPIYIGTGVLNANGDIDRITSCWQFQGAGNGSYKAASKVAVLPRDYHYVVIPNLNAKTDPIVATFTAMFENGWASQSALVHAFQASRPECVTSNKASAIGHELNKLTAQAIAKGDQRLLDQVRRLDQQLSEVAQAVASLTDTSDDKATPAPSTRSLGMNKVGGKTFGASTLNSNIPASAIK